MEGVVKFLFWFLSLSKIDHVTNLQLKNEEIVDLPSPSIDSGAIEMDPKALRNQERGVCFIVAILDCVIFLSFWSSSQPESYCFYFGFIEFFHFLFTRLLLSLWLQRCNDDDTYIWCPSLLRHKSLDKSHIWDCAFTL